ncbi:MAG: right-handed parallel beta-helix repeat-containing protein [Actinobacteria bacterium]|nr:right-handed parallel beta-helix repeat-containing protein [Actinomycetota bacterium]
MSRRRSPARTIRVLAGCFFLVLLPGLAKAQTDHRGTCSGVFTASGNPHRLTGGCTVPASEVLTLEPGVVLEGANNTLAIDGELNASGVTFRSVSLSYRTGSGGTLENSTLSPSTSISIGGSLVTDPASPVIRGNTIDATNIGVDVSGTARPTIEGNRITAANVGLDFSGTAAGTASGNTIRFRPETGGNRTGVRIFNVASPSVTGNTIEDDPTRNDTGVLLSVDAESTASVTANSIATSGGDRPVILSVAFFAASAGATFSGNTFSPGVALPFSVQGALGTDGELEPVQGIETLVFQSTVSVSDGATLTVASGMTLEGANNTLAIDGTLNASGVTFRTVFLSYRTGSGGTIENSTLSPSGGISIGGSLVTDPASPVIRGNTIDAANIGVDVSGTARPTIEGNAITTQNVGLDFSGTAAGTARGNTIRFRPETGSGRVAVRISSAASPSVTENAIEDDPLRSDTGIQVGVDPASSASVRLNTICATSDDRPLTVSVHSRATVADNIFPCGRGLGNGFLGGTVNADASFAPIDGDEHVSLIGTLSVAAGATLTVPDGLTVEGGSSSINVDGVLAVDGAVLRNVFLTFRAGGEGIITGSTLSGPRNSGVTTVRDATLTLRGSVVEEMNQAIVLTGDASLLAEESIFRGNLVVLDLNGTAARATLRRNLFESNERLARFSNADSFFSSFPTFDGNSFFGARDQNSIVLPSRFDASGTLPAAPVPYAAPGTVTVESQSTVIVEPGCVLMFGPSQELRADGELVAVGLPELPIVFTADAPKQGRRWGGLTIRGKGPLSTTALENVIVEFARTGVVLENASIPIRGSLIADSNIDGIALTDSSPVIEDSAIVQNIGHGIVAGPGSNPVVSGCVIFGNGANGIQNESAAATIDAELNFWGDDSGPRDLGTDSRCGTLSNPDGLGEDVSDCVDFDPWLRVGPSVEGTLRVVSGNGQTGQVGEDLADPLVMEVRSLLDSALEGIEVIFSVVEGDAEILEEMPLATGPDGRAAATVRLGETAGDVVIAVTARDVNSPLATFLGEANAPCLLVMKAVGEPSSRADGVFPGDVNLDQSVDTSDVQALLDILFLGRGELPCEGAFDGPANREFLDWNGDDRVDLSDAVGQLEHLYLGGPAHVFGPSGECARVSGCAGSCDARS